MTDKDRTEPEDAPHPDALDDWKRSFAEWKKRVEIRYDGVETQADRLALVLMKSHFTAVIVGVLIGIAFTLGAWLF